MPWKERVCGIYVIRRTGTDECYVGQSVNMWHRWSGHRKALGKGTHRSLRMQRVHDKYGLDALVFSILCQGIDPEDKELLTVLEQEWMDKLHPCFNTAPAAGSTYGMPKTDETRRRQSVAQRKRFEDPAQRAKMSLVKKGMPSPWKGRSPTEEARAKMSDAKLGKPSPFKGKTHTTSSLTKISASQKARFAKEGSKDHYLSTHVGRKASEETKSKMSKSHKIRAVSSMEAR